MTAPSIWLARLSGLTIGPQPNLLVSLSVNKPGRDIRTGYLLNL